MSELSPNDKEYRKVDLVEKLTRGCIGAQGFIKPLVKRGRRRRPVRADAQPTD